MFMRIISLVFILFLAFNNVNAQNLKIGYVDSRMILLKVKSFQKAQEQLNIEIQKEDKKLAQMQKEIQDLADQLEKQKMVLSEEVFNQKKEELNRKYLEYQNYMQQIYGPQGKLQKKREELSKPLLEKAEKVIQKIAKQEKYDMILDAGIGAVLYADPKYDLTQRVIDELNKEK